MSMDKWTDEECRYFFQLFAEEKKKGNKPKSGMTQTGKASIIKKFTDRFGETHTWEKFKNKYDTSRRVHLRWKRLIHNMTGLGYDAAGRLDMSSAWWNERIAEWPGAQALKKALIPNLDLFEEEFGAISVTGAEGWSAQQGETSLDSRVATEKEDEYDSIDNSIPVAETQNTGEGSKSKRKFKEVVLVTEISVTRNEILAQKNKLMEQRFHHEYSYSVEHVLEVLNNLHGWKKWSPFHRAAIYHLIADASNRQRFIAFASNEDKINYLEYRTGKFFYD